MVSYFLKGKNCCTNNKEIILKRIVKDCLFKKAFITSDNHLLSTRVP